MRQSLQLRLGQQLTMTPQLQQAIKLLQLSTLDLQLEIQNALESNLMLEVDEAERQIRLILDPPSAEVGASYAGKVAFTITSGPALEKGGDLIGLLTHLESNDILFIDEIHTIVGAGGATGSLDAANMLKPALARGEIQCIGATTLDEYRQHIEKDGALERRFQKVMVEPTNIEETIEILHIIGNKIRQQAIFFGQHFVNLSYFWISVCTSHVNSHM